MGVNYKADANILRNHHVMKTLPRTQFGNPILRAKAKSVPVGFLKTKEFKSLVRQMVFTMRRVGGVGLAAPQVGRSLALAVMEMRKTPMRPDLLHRGPIVIINPKILKYSQAAADDWEGCLSFTGARGVVPRAETILVRYTNETGKTITETAAGFWARIFQHEIDHLNGVVYVDRMKNMKSLTTLAELKRRMWQK
ncbi:MAG: peptide deformylase [Candidatus Sungbacteria bacterium]|nr:peptide deformylase [Candidatus Sungbacteria bacterium]